MRKLTFFGFAGVVAFLLAAFGPRPWAQQVAVDPATSISPYALTLSADPIAASSGADTF